MKPMTRTQITELEENGKRPADFTGKWKGVLYYRGRLWTGQSNRIGCRADRPFTLYENKPNQFAVRPK